MRIGAIIVVVWLVIGVIAAFQRDYFSNAKAERIDSPCRVTEVERPDARPALIPTALQQ